MVSSNETAYGHLVELDGLLHLLPDPSVHPFRQITLGSQVVWIIGWPISSWSWVK